MISINFYRIMALVAAILCNVIGMYAKDFNISISSNPEGAKVYMNGRLVSYSTPCIITVDKKEATKVLVFRFEKDGYESSTTTVQFKKKQLLYNPVVYMQMRKISVNTGDPTVTPQQANQRVTRESAGQSDMEKTILRWYFDSDPRGARVFYRVISSVPSEVKNTNETYLTTTPYEETKSFNILGLTYNNSRDVTIEIKVTKRGYEDQIKRFNVRQALDQQEISAFFELVPKDEPALQEY